MKNWLLGSTIALVLLGSSGAMAEQPSLVLVQATEQHQTEADRLLVLGFQQLQSSQFREALPSLEKALELYRAMGNRSRERNALIGLGVAYQSLGEYPQAIEYSQESLIIAREIGDRTGEGNALNNLGNVYQLLGEYPKAIEFYQQSLIIKRESSDRAGEGSTFNNLGSVYQLLGEYPKAIEFYEQSLTIAQEIGDRAVKNNALNNLGNVYQLLGEYPKAIEFYEQSLTLAREIGDRTGEGNTINNLGNVYQLLGEYPRAINHYQQSLAIVREIGNRAVEGKIFDNLGIVYQLLGQYPRAIDYHQQSLTIRREIGDRSGEGRTLNNLGNVYQVLAEYSKANEHYQQSLAIAREISDRAVEGSSLSNLGDIYQLWEKYPQAIDYHQQSLAIAKEIGNRVTEGNALRGLGNLYRLLREYPKAIDLYQQSLSITREIGNSSGESISLYALAIVKNQQGNLDDALKDIAASIAIAESIRAEVENPDLRQSFFATVSDRYQLYIDILMQLHRQNPDRGYDKQAFQASEKNRARTLTELLTEANLNIRQNLDPQLLKEEQRLLQELSTAEQNRLKLVSSSYENAELDRLKGKRDTLLQQLSDLETRIRRNNPSYADLKYPQPLTLEEIQTNILDQDTLLLEYALGGDRSYLFVVGKNEFSTYELPSRAEIEAATEKYAIALQTEDRNPLAEGKDLAQILLSPVADKLKKQRLAIVADGKLHRLPFGALPWGSEDNPLLVNHEIINLSSASSLAIGRQQSANRSPATKKVAVFADPVFSKRDPRLSGEVATNPENSLLELFREGCQSFDRLPNTRIEAENILALVPDNQEFLAMGFEANRAAATSNKLSQYQILHLSTHGCIQDNPQLSGLALSFYDENGQQKDGFLRLQDIYNLKLNADLVVLSACQTGIGEEVSGEGVVGLTRGFMYAGAKRVTVSLWNVSDRATANLMSNYYQKMISEGLEPAAALRQAQLQMWREGEYPYKWAAFTIQGDWQ